MPAVVWTLEYNSTVKPLASWGIRRPVLTFRNLDVDELTFTIPRSNALAAAVFPVNADLVLYRDGVGWFRGRVVRGAAHGDARTEGDAYIVRGPWWRLQRLVYQQAWCIAGVMQVTPRVTLGQDQWARAITIGAQLHDVLVYALTKSIPIAAGALPVFQKAWLEEARDLTCAGAILRVLRFAPDAVSSFDYANSVPVLNIRQRAAMSAVSIDATAGDYLAEFSGIGPRNDLVPAGVTFIYIDNAIDVVSGRTKSTLTRDEAGATNGEGAIVAVVDLADKGTDPHESPPSGLALAYWAALQTVQYEGTIRVLEEDCTGTLRPGKVLNIANGRAEWAAMRAVIQSVTENLEAGETVAELGAPEHLAPQDFVQQQQLARRRIGPTAFPRVQACQRATTPAPDEVDPAEPDPLDLEDNEDAGVDPSSLTGEDTINNMVNSGSVNMLLSTVDIPYCADGIETCARVVGAPVSCSG